MPVIMTRVWPIAMIQLPTAIYMISEFMNSLRTIYLDGRPHTDPDIVVRTFNGESIGRWEGDTLVVDTRNFTDLDKHWVDQGIPASKDFRMIERYRLINNGNTLEGEWTLIDPQNWEGEWKGTRRWNRVTDHDIQEVAVPARSERAPAEHVVQGPYSNYRRYGGTMKSILGLAAALAIAAIAPLAAHHSPAAFEPQKTVTLVGTVKEFRWQNPHTWIEVLVPNEKGEEVLWAVETTSPTYLVRAGWKSTTLQPGDKVTVVGRPLKSGEPGIGDLHVGHAGRRPHAARAARAPRRARQLTLYVSFGIRDSGFGRLPALSLKPEV